MMRLNINILIFFLFFITSCSNSDEESNISSANETVIVEVEEAVEVVIAANLKDKKQTISESADLLFHLMLLWNKLEIKEEDIAKELLRRKK